MLHNQSRKKNIEPDIGRSLAAPDWKSFISEFRMQYLMNFFTSVNSFQTLSGLFCHVRSSSYRNSMSSKCRFEKSTSENVHTLTSYLRTLNIGNHCFTNSLAEISLRDTILYLEQTLDFLSHYDLYKIQVFTSVFKFLYSKTMVFVLIEIQLLYHKQVVAIFLKKVKTIPLPFPIDLPDWLCRMNPVVARSIASEEWMSGSDLELSRTWVLWDQNWFAFNLDLNEHLSSTRRTDEGPDVQSSQWEQYKDVA